MDSQGVQHRHGACGLEASIFLLMLRFILFLVINLGALGLGSWLMGDPSTNVWYQSLNRAPWEPPYWFFGVAWMTIMLCFSIFLWRVSMLYPAKDLTLFYTFYVVQFILNVMWNPTFFRAHYVGVALVMIVVLFLLVLWFTVFGIRRTGIWGLLMLPYLVWLAVAAALNWYVLVHNSATSHPI